MINFNMPKLLHNIKTIITWVVDRDIIIIVVRITKEKNKDNIEEI